MDYFDLRLKEILYMELKVIDEKTSLIGQKTQEP